MQQHVQCTIYKCVIGIYSFKGLSLNLGVWGASIGAMAGVKVPLVAMKHAYVVTERIEGVQNMPNVRDHDASVYLKLQGDTLQVYL